MNKTLKTLLILLIILGLGILGYFVYQKYFKQKSTTSNEKINIPEIVTNNKFGFLSAGPGESAQILEYGARWLRPHPGSFLWDNMQAADTSKFSFKDTDKIVSEAQKNEIGLLATLWPFAEWDQDQRPDASNCMVSQNDEFLATNDKKGRGEYLTLHRCAPHDWTKYSEWLKQTVERYDGDGIDDMPGLKIPIKYWEVMNEPDLPLMPDGKLVFWKDSPEQYGKLLIESSKTIKEADPEAKILIAGAAGGSSQFLDFYRQVFKNTETISAFDIGNVHCITNDENNDFNVSAYIKMLNEFGLVKDVWVTEAENMKSASLDQNASTTEKSIQGAVKAGAKRIFFTRYNFEDSRTDMSQKNEESPASIQKSKDLYKKYIQAIQ